MTLQESSFTHKTPAVECKLVNEGRATYYNRTSLQNGT